MRSWEAFGSARIPPAAAIVQVSGTTAETSPVPSKTASIDSLARVAGAANTASKALGLARDLARAFASAPSQDSRGQLIHALTTLARFRPPQQVTYDDIVAIRELRKTVQAFAREPQHAELAWRGAVVARFAEAYRDEPVADEVQKTYSQPAGVRWKDYSDTYFGPTEARATYNALYHAAIIPGPGAPLRFVSAAANSATHEVAMFEHDCRVAPDRKGGRQFIVGDIADVPARTLPGPTFGDGFLHVRWNAAQLPLAPGSVDVLWDRKGCVWFALMNDYQNPNQGLGRSPLMALAVLAHYHEILKPGGSIVLDAIPGFDRVIAANGGRPGSRDVLSSHATQQGVAPQMERSTADAIELVARESEVDVLGLLATRFAMRFVGEGVTRCLVLTKSDSA